MWSRIGWIILIAMLVLLTGCNLEQSPEVATPEVLATAETVLACDQLVATALQSAEEACAEIGRNQACYGNRLITTEFQENATSIFNTIGDITDVFSIKKLTTAPL